MNRLDRRLHKLEDQLGTRNRAAFIVAEEGETADMAVARHAREHPDQAGAEVTFIMVLSGSQ